MVTCCVKLKAQVVTCDELVVWRVDRHLTVKRRGANLWRVSSWFRCRCSACVYQCVRHRWLGCDKSYRQRQSSSVWRHQLPKSPRPLWTTAVTAAADSRIPRAKHRSARTGRCTSVLLVRRNRSVSSGPVVACLTAVWKILGSNSTVGSSDYQDSLGHGRPA